MEGVDASEGALDAKRACDVDVSDGKGPIDVNVSDATGPIDANISDAKGAIDVMGGDDVNVSDAKGASDVMVGDKAASGWGEPSVAPEVLGRERVLYWQPAGPNSPNHRHDFSGPALRHGSLNSLFLDFVHMC